MIVSFPYVFIQQRSKNSNAGNKLYKYYITFLTDVYKKFKKLENNELCDKINSDFSDVVYLQLETREVIYGKQEMVSL